MNTEDIKILLKSLDDNIKHFNSSNKSQFEKILEDIIAPYFDELFSTELTPQNRFNQFKLVKDILSRFTNVISKLYKVGNIDDLLPIKGLDTFLIKLKNDIALSEFEKASKAELNKILDDVIVKAAQKSEKIAAQKSLKDDDEDEDDMDDDPVEAKPVEAKPVEAKPTKVKPAEVKPTEVKPTEVKSTEVKPTEVKQDVKNAKRNVGILRQSDAATLLKVRVIDKGTAVYKYVVLTKEDLGNKPLNLENVWGYLLNRKNDKSWLKDNLTSFNTAFDEFKKSESTVSNDLKSYIKQYVGSSHKDVLMNAFRRVSPKIEFDLAPVLSNLNDDQIAKLFDYYRFKETQHYSDKVKQFLQGMKRSFSPLEENKYNINFNKLIIEVNLLTQLADKIKEQSLLFKLGIDKETLQYIRMALKYDALVKAITNDLPRFKNVLVKMGVDVSSLPSKLFNREKIESPGANEVDAGDQTTSGQAVGDQTVGDQTASDQTASGQVQDNTIEFNDQRFMEFIKNNYLYALLFKEVNESKELTRALKKMITNTLVQLKVAADGKAIKHFGVILSGLNLDVRNYITGQARNIIKKISEVKPGFLSKLSGLFSKLKGKLPFANRLKRESYARIILDNQLIEENRIKANMCVTAALDIYGEQCRKLNRKYIDNMFDESKQDLFDNYLSEATKFANKYSHLLQNCGIDIDCDLNGLNLLESLMYIKCLTSNPLDDDYRASTDMSIIAEDYCIKCINQI